MFPRALQPPRSRKRTWIRSHFEDAHLVNLLPAESMLRYECDPSHFRAEVLARPTTQWVVVDEVQGVPKLLDEVHFLTEEKGYERFALTASSARKLKRGAANLLAARILRKLFPKGIDALHAGRTARSYIVYGGTQELEVEGTRVLPLETFLRRLHAGEIVGWCMATVGAS